MATRRPARTLTAAISIALAALAGGCLAAQQDSKALADAQQKCDPGKVGTTVSDDGRTLIVNTAGEEDTSGVAPSVTGCILRELGAAAEVLARVERPSDPSDSWRADWNGYVSVWMYHPNGGSDLTIQES